MNIRKVTDISEIKLTDLMNAMFNVNSGNVIFKKEHQLVYYNPDAKILYEISGEEAKEIIEKKIIINIEK